MGDWCPFFGSSPWTHGEKQCFIFLLSLVVRAVAFRMVCMSFKESYCFPNSMECCTRGPKEIVVTVVGMFIDNCRCSRLWADLKLTGLILDSRRLTSFSLLSNMCCPVSAYKPHCKKKLVFQTCRLWFIQRWSKWGESSPWFFFTARFCKRKINLLTLKGTSFPLSTW